MYGFNAYDNFFDSADTKTNMFSWFSWAIKTWKMIAILLMI